MLEPVGLLHRHAHELPQGLLEAERPKEVPDGAHQQHDDGRPRASTELERRLAANLRLLHATPCGSGTADAGAEF